MALPPPLREVYESLPPDEESSSARARCRLCGNVYLFTGSTGNLYSHARSQHEALPLKRVRSGSPTAAAAARHDQAARDAAVLEHLRRFFAEGMLPFSLIEHPNLLAAFQSFAPEFRLPDRKSWRQGLLQRAEDMRNAYLPTLKNANYAISMDLWTSSANDAYLMILAHDITDEWKLRHLCLTLQHVVVQHTGDNIAECVKSVISGWSPPSAVVTDGAANMRAAARVLEGQHIVCAAHTLHNAVSAALRQMRRRKGGGRHVPPIDGTFRAVADGDPEAESDMHGTWTFGEEADPRPFHPLVLHVQDDQESHGHATSARGSPVRISAAAVRQRLAAPGWHSRCPGAICHHTGSMVRTSQADTVDSAAVLQPAHAGIGGACRCSGLRCLCRCLGG
jgi:hypothetical protein